MLAEDASMEGMNRFLSAVVLFFICTGIVHAQELVLDTVTTEKAQVVEILSQETKKVSGTDTPATVQSIKVKFLEGTETGLVVNIQRLGSTTGLAFSIASASFGITS